MIGALLRRAVNQPETWSGMALIVWAWWVAFSPGGLDGLQIYRALTTAISSHMLIWTALGIGTLQLGAILWNRRWPRVVMTFFAAAFLLTLTHGLWMGAPTAPGAALSLTLGVMDMALMLLLCCPKRPA